MKQKILIWDIESSLNEVLCFDTHEQNIQPDNIIVERYIHCIAYRWYGEKTVHLISQLDDPHFKKHIHSDEYVLRKFREVISQADAWVAHYGSHFDIKMVNGRLLLNGLEPLPNIKSYDTCILARSHFKLNYNNLDYLAKSLGYKGKTHNAQGLWRRCFEGDVKSLKQMGNYCKNDVDILTYVFEKLLPFLKTHPITPKNVLCQNPICQSNDIEYRGYCVNKTGKHRRYQCKHCGSWGMTLIEKFKQYAIIKTAFELCEEVQIATDIEIINIKTCTTAGFFVFML